jgi:uncharacterized protein (DUF2267 family)
MKQQNPNPDLMLIAQALSDLRDFWMQVSMVLKDYVADTPSPASDEVKRQVERHIARIKDGARGFVDK